MLKETVLVKDTALYRDVREAVAQREMFDRGDTVLVAVSGGIDSVVLLSVLHELSDELALTLVVCHLNHNLRGAESERDLRFTSTLASALGLRFESETLEEGSLTSEGGSTQASARKARYGFFESVSKKAGARRIAIAHTLDDVTETMLMRFISGAGIGGLAGIAPVRLPYVRPLIDSSREEIEAFASEVGLEFVLDSSNASDKYLRNDIRHNLIGFLKEKYNPNLLKSLARSAENFRRDEEYIDEAATELFGSALERKSGHEIVFDRKLLFGKHPALLSRVLLKATEIFRARADFYSIHVDAMLSLLNSSSPSGSLNLPEGLRFVRDYDSIRLTATPASEPQSYDIELKAPGRTVLPKILSDDTGSPGDSSGGSILATVIDTLPPEHKIGHEAGYKEGEATAYFDLYAIIEALGHGRGDDTVDGADMLEGLRVRTFIAGDRMGLFGMSGHRKVKELFIDAKVPRPVRASLPFVTVNESIIWIAGLRRSSLFLLTGKTRRALKLEYLK